MRRKTLTLSLLATTVLLLAACGSTSDILGGGNDTRNNVADLRGTIDSVDLNSRTIVLTNVSGYNSMLSNSGSNGSSVRVSFDDRTTVDFNGRGYRPSDLERGDEVSVRVNESGRELVAETVTVLRDVSSGTSTTSGGYATNVRGTVRYVDTYRHTIEVDRGNGTSAFVEYDNRTGVSYGGRTYNVSDLERGDEVDIRVSDLGSGRYLAQDVTVVRSTSSGSNNGGIFGNSNAAATIRGTVRYVDTSRRTIELEQTSFLNGFVGGGSNNATIVVQYGSNATVDVNGRAYPVTNLERGDVIEVQADRSGTNSNTYFANRIFLVRDVNAR